MILKERRGEYDERRRENVSFVLFKYLNSFVKRLQLLDFDTDKAICSTISPRNDQRETDNLLVITEILTRILKK